MDRINHASAEQDKFGAGKDGWTNGDPADPGSGTVPQEEWLDGVQEELVGLIEQASDTPTDADYTQLAAVLLAKIGGYYQAAYGVKFVGLDDLVPLLSDYTTLTANRKVLFTIGPSASQVNVYRSDEEAIEFVYNAAWEHGTGWVSSGSNEGMISLTLEDGSAGPFVRFHKTLVSNSFTETSTIVGDAGLGLPIVANALYPAAATKAASYVRYNNSTTGVASGYVLNVSGGTSSSSILTVSFGTPFADTNYAVQVTSANISTFHQYTGSPNTTSSCTVIARDAAGAALLPASNDLQFFIDVKGVQ